MVYFSLGLCLIASGGLQGRVLDDFNDGVKTSWEDFTFIPDFGIPAEGSGQFKFYQTPSPVGQPIFSGSVKTSETFDLQDGRTIEFRIDMVDGYGQDSFAVLGFIPTANDPKSLAGYAIAKSSTDVLITKGIGKYFYNENPTPAIKNTNVTLVLTLTGEGANVVIRGRILDKDNANAVLFDQTFVDTPAEDVLSDGDDKNPSTPYLATGRFVLFLYQDYLAGTDHYEVTLDNAQVFELKRTVIDDFNDGVKTSWEDFTFIPDFGIPAEGNGQFKFYQTPSPVGQPIFSGSVKTSETFDLQDGRTIELRIDMIDGYGQDSFAVLGFIPTANDPKSLAGYAIAKSSTDVLITKGIGKYFYNENPTPAIKNTNVTLVLTLTGEGPNVVIQGRVLDKDNANAVLFDQTFVDTPAEDVLSDGDDKNPSTPYLATGRFVLFLYQDYLAGTDHYEVTLDNAVVWAPPSDASKAPEISNVQPANYANFLPATTTISFQVTDDKPLADDGISVTLNGTVYTRANGLAVTGTGSMRQVALGGLAAGQNYIARLAATDSDSQTAAITRYFDTFTDDSIVIEAEDFNYAEWGPSPLDPYVWELIGGRFYDHPVPTPEYLFGPWVENAYGGHQGLEGIDFHDTRATPDAGDPEDYVYRPLDPVVTLHSVDLVRKKFSDAGGVAASVFDYDVSEVRAGEWLNYTRTFAPGSYHVYLRQSVVNMTTTEAILEKVAGDVSGTNQTAQVLGSFLGEKTGYVYRNFPLTDGLGLNRIVVKLFGQETLRLRQVTPDGDPMFIGQNYLVLVPAQDPGVQRASVASLAPAPNSTAEGLNPVIAAVIQNRDTSVRADSIVLELNHAQVAPTIQTNADGAAVTYAISPLPPSGQVNTARLVFADSDGVFQTNEWSFTLLYLSLDPATRKIGTGRDPGFRVRVVQALAPSDLDSSIARAELQLSSGSPFAEFCDTNVIAPLINFSQTDGTANGSFASDVLVPGLEPEVNGTDDIAMEIFAYLELSPGTYRFGVHSDDGYKIASGAEPLGSTTPPLKFRNGTANETFDFIVSEAGHYPFRMIWYERGGSAHVEWFFVDPGSGQRRLINDLTQAGGIRAFTRIELALRLQSAAAVGGPYADDPAATVSPGLGTITLPVPTAPRFYRLIGPASTRIDSIRVDGSALTLTYR